MMRRALAGFFVGAGWATWTAVGPPTPVTEGLLVGVLTWLLWPDLQRAWTYITH